MNAISLRRTLRLGSGVMLMMFVIEHLVGVSLGLVSVELMDHWRPKLMGVWSTPVGQVLLMGSLVVHLALTLASVAARRSLQVRAADAAQIALGLLLPILLALHVMVIRGLAGLLGLHATYAWILAVFWKTSPTLGLQQVLVVVVAWIHGCLGLQAWLTFKPTWPRVAPFLYPVAVALPITALLGFVEAGKDALARLDHDPAFAAAVDNFNALAGPTVPMLIRAQQWFIAIYALIVAGLAVAHFVRAATRRRAVARVHYLDGPTVTAPRGLSILEISRLNDVPHASLCSGRGRCGTCRVHVISGGGALSPIDPEEARVLARVGAEKGTRLGCHARALGAALTIERLIDPGIDLTTARHAADPLEAGHTA